MPTIVHPTARPATAPVDRPPDFWEVVDLFEEPPNGAFELVLAGAVLAVDAAEVLEGVEEAVLEDEDEVVVLCVVVVGRTLEVVLIGAIVETVAPDGTKVTISSLRGIWNRPIPESQQPA
jgi:hypothetical protein